MSGRTDIIITTLVMLSLACMLASFVVEAAGSNPVNLALCACWAALMALFVLVYARGGAR